MVRWIALGFVALLVLFAAAQLIRPARSNPRTDFSQTIDARFGPPSPLAPILARACGDCHSNRTVWARYTQIAPLSWVVASAVTEGRKAVNFSEWAAYSPSQQAQLLAQSCQDAAQGKMPPGVFIQLQPAARLSAQEVKAICSAEHGPDRPAPSSGGHA